MAGRPNPVSMWKARKGYEDFTGAKPTKEQVVNLDRGNVAGYRLGSMVGVAYEATRDGKTDQYFHRFKKKARPELVARSDGKQLYIAGGDYKVTDRGIEDMAGELFIVNPSRRRRRRASTGRKTNGQFLKNPSRRKRAPRRRRAKTQFLTNPIRNPVRRRRRRSAVAVRRYRRNPSGLARGKGSFSISAIAMPAAMVGAGALGTEVLMGYLTFLPPTLTTGPQRYATKGLIGVLAGWALAKYFNKRAGEAFAAGAIAIATHDALKSAVTTYMPTVQFGGANWNGYGYDSPSLGTFHSPGIGYYSPGATLKTAGMGQYLPPPGMGQYMDLARGGMGEGTWESPIAAFPDSG